MAYLYKQTDGNYIISLFKPFKQDNRWILPEPYDSPKNYKIITRWVAEAILQGKTLTSNTRPFRLFACSADDDIWRDIFGTEV